MNDYLAIVKLSAAGAAGKAKFAATDVMHALSVLREKTRTQSTNDIYEYEVFKIVKSDKGGEGLVSVARKLATSQRSLPAVLELEVVPVLEELQYTHYTTQAA